MSHGRRRREVVAGVLVAAALMTGCAGPGVAPSWWRPQPPGFAVGTDGIVRVALGRGPRFVPWGFNYDWTRIDGRLRLLEDALAERPERVEADLAAMRARGANTVRVFLATTALLRGPEELDPEGLARIEGLFDAAERQGVRLLVTGLAHLRRDALPAWLADADDDTLRVAERSFWRSLARAGRGRRAVFAWDLQNEPALPAEDGGPLVEGCFDTELGNLCYVHRPFRQLALQRQRWVREHPEHAEDERRFRAALLADWGRHLVELVRREDPDHPVTIGALFPTVVSPAVDFFSVHLYPRGAPEQPGWLADNRRGWRRAVERLPGDRPVLVEEFAPIVLGYAGRVPAARVVDALLDATRRRAAGWLSFYWYDPDGPEAASLGPDELATYRALLDAWQRRAPRAQK